MKNQLTQNVTETKHQIAVHFPQTNDRFNVDIVETSSHLLSDFGFRKYTIECLEKFNSFKETLTSELANKYSELLDLQGVRHAVSEADALAAFTAFPSLFLPVLAEEKVQAAAQWNARQRDIRARSYAMAA